MALCRNCGRSEVDHDLGWCVGVVGKFSPAGRIGHEQAGIGGVAFNDYSTPTLPSVGLADKSTSVFLTGMSIKPKSNPKYHAALKELADLHDKKSQDYADTGAGKWYTNFEEAAATAGISVEEVFMALIGVKLARLRELKKKGLTPQNESVQDSRKDLANYAILMYSYFID